jgi:hypothetical protein
LRHLKDNVNFKINIGRVKEIQPMIELALYRRQPVAPAAAALLHRTAELHVSAALKANKTTAPETDLVGPEQPSFGGACGSDYYSKYDLYTCNEWNKN